MSPLRDIFAPFKPLPLIDEKTILRARMTHGPEEAEYLLKMNEYAKTLNRQIRVMDTQFRISMAIGLVTVVAIFVASLR